jgi:hypothetical protein
MQTLILILSAAVFLAVMLAMLPWFIPTWHQHPELETLPRRSQRKVRETVHLKGGKTLSIMML